MRSTIIFFIIAPTSLAFFCGLIASLSKNLSNKIFWTSDGKKDDKDTSNQS